MICELLWNDDNNDDKYGNEDDDDDYEDDKDVMARGLSVFERCRLLAINVSNDIFRELL